MKNIIKLTKHLSLVTVMSVVTITSAAFAAGDLKSVESFASIDDENARSVALFKEIGKVIQHPRCVNCHPAGPSPMQGMEMKPHTPPVERGLANFGLPGMECNTCHQSENIRIYSQAESIKSVPGNPKWHLAPIEMAWEGKTLSQICKQIKDKDRNGGKDMDELVHHMAEDILVGWGWEPGEGREPVPGTQENFGKLVKAWVASGAVCPTS